MSPTKYIVRAHPKVHNGDGGGYVVFKHDIEFEYDIDILSEAIDCARVFNAGSKYYAEVWQLVQVQLDTEKATPGQGSGGFVQRDCVPQMDDYCPEGIPGCEVLHLPPTT